MRILSSLLALCSAALTASAGNLIINGDFEAAALAPWVGGIVVPSGTNHLLTAAPSSKQTVVTEIGVRYYAAVDVGTVAIGGTATITATPTGGVIPDGSKIFSTAPVGLPPFPATPATSGRIGFIFTASTASTDIAIAATAFPGFPDTTTFDNVVLYKISSTRLAGRYSGSVSTTLSVVDPAISNKSSARAAARVATDARFAVLLGTSQVLSGILLDDNSYEVTTSTGTLVRGTNGVKAGRLVLTLPGTLGTTLDIGGSFLTTSSTTKLSLTKVGR